MIPLEDRMFDSDSICMGALSAKTLSIVEKDSGRAVRVGIEGYPYVLIWACPATRRCNLSAWSPGTACPDRADAAGDWNEKPLRRSPLRPAGMAHRPEYDL